MSPRISRPGRVMLDWSQIWPTVIVILMLLLSACSGGLSRRDAALFSRALGDALQEQNYSQQTGAYDPKQVALAQQSGLSNEDVARLMLGLQHSLVANYAQDANLQPPSDPMALFRGRDELASAGLDRWEDWLSQQGWDQVKSALEGFRNQPAQKQLDDLLKAAGAAGMEYGYFDGAGTFWFRDPVTGEFSAFTLVNRPGERLLIFIEGVASRTSHPRYQSITSWSVTIAQVEMWREETSGWSSWASGECCENKIQQLTVVTSIDPKNLLSDPPGFGKDAYIAEDQVISYTIQFENPSSAQAPAGDLTVMADLGPGIDLESVLLGPSSHPEGITAEIDESDGSITWFFQDIMLPPNHSPPEGEGWVRFSARPRSDVVSGTLLSTRAAIRFDYLAPVETNPVVYTIDSDPPATEVYGLAPVQLSPSFDVPWAGWDDAGGSGLQNVTLLVSEDDGPFRVLGVFSEPPIPFQGEIGKTYGFATVGTDRVGHTEAIPENPDATVTVGQLLSLEPGWQLIGVPVISQQSPQQLLTRPGTNWSAWDSSQQTYLPVGRESTDWPVTAANLPGSGLWANFDAGTSYYIIGEAVPIDRPYSIELKPGWNLIANPFSLPLEWDLNAIRVSVAGVDTTLADAQNRQWTEDFAWGWNGNSYSLVYSAGLVAGGHSALEPFKGYWFQSHRDATLTLFPPAIK